RAPAVLEGRGAPGPDPRRSEAVRGRRRRARLPPREGLIRPHSNQARAGQKRPTTPRTVLPAATEKVGVTDRARAGRDDGAPSSMARTPSTKTATAAPTASPVSPAPTAQKLSSVCEQSTTAAPTKAPSSGA